MKSSFHLVIGLLALLSTQCFAGQPTNDLSAKQAVKLIALKANVPENTIEISFIVDGRLKSESFDVEHVRRVATIHGVQEDARQRRKLVFYDLFWNEPLGWFMWECRNERAGEAVYIWSESRGSIVSR
jgi:hypothetical protein